MRRGKEVAHRQPRRYRRTVIEKVKFRNFKGLRSVDVDLAQFTMIVGPNSSGKSSSVAGSQRSSGTTG